jgi:ribosomal protein L37AE/L43A
LAERMKTHKPELLAALHASEPGQGQTTVRCPWCRSTELTTAAGGLACSDCSQRAWLFKGGIITRADVAVTEAQVIDPPPPCPACGGSEFWQTVQGNWRCLACNPPTTARRLRKLAARLKPDGAGPGRSEREL